MDDLNLPDSTLPDDSDDLVRQWAGRRAFRKDELQRLSASICRQVELHVEKQPAVSRKFAILGTLALAAAAAVIYFVCSLQFASPAADDDDLLLATQAAVPIERLRILARESGRLFDHRVSWLAETNHDLLLGLDSAPASTEESKLHITFRVVVFHRATSSQKWKPVFTTNVVTREEEVVQLNGQAAGSTLRLWTHILPDRSVAVDTQLALGDLAAHEWSTTSILSAEGAMAVLKETGEQGEYQVWQSASIIADEDL
jgi:hypothetical protein